MVLLTATGTVFDQTLVVLSPAMKSKFQVGTSWTCLESWGGWLTLHIVLLQAMKQEPPADAKCRDKFLVQSVTITGDKDFTNVQQIVGHSSQPAVKKTIPY